MAPPSSAKRKRGDPQEAPARPSPHRPQNVGATNRSNETPSRQYQNPHSVSRGGRGRGRGGRGNHQPPRGGAHPTPPALPAARETPAASDEQLTASVPVIEHSKPSTPNPQPAPQRLPPSEIPTLPTAPLEPDGPYHYKTITDDRIATWSETGQEEALNAAKLAIEKNDDIALSIIFQEAIQAGLYKELNPQRAGRFIKSIIESYKVDIEVDLVSTFLDVLDVKAEAFEWKSPSFDWKNAKHFPEIPYFRNILSFSEIPLQTIREILDGQFLEALGLVRQKAFKGTFIRKQTDILYKTGNFNLLREESEGYAKLMIELLTTLSAANPREHPWSHRLVQPLLENIQALLGAFRLDAARTLDVILDIFGSNIVVPCRFIAKFLRRSPYWPPERTYDLKDIEPAPLTGLPMWAQPDHEGWFLSPEQEAGLTSWKLTRDNKFWDRVRDIGTDAFFELGRRRLLGSAESLLHTTAEQVNDAHFEQSKIWIETTKALPPPGDHVAAQLVGFKLQFHTKNPDEKNEAAENNIINLAALLIKIGFISLRDLYPHVHPPDDQMQATKEKQQKLKDKSDAQKHGGGAIGALASAGALPDEEVPSAVTRLRQDMTRASTPSRSDGASQIKSDEVAVKEDTPEPMNQKIQLLRQLLLLGCVPEALFMIGLHTWMIDLYPDLPEYLHRIFHQMFSELHEPISPLRNRSSIMEPAKFPVPDHTSPNKGSVKLVDEHPRQRLRWPKLERSESEARDYRFYWDDWTDNIPVCRSVDDFFALCNTLLNLTGVKIGQDPMLLTKMARIGRQSLTEDFSQHNQDRWIELVKRLICPALSLTKSDTTVVSEVWEVITMFPTKIRYGIYNEWYLGPTSRNPDVAAAMKATEREAKSVLKFMSADKESARRVARQLAKVACASPGKVFDSSIRQLESYQNMITVFVEGGRYFTYMGYDVLAWALLSSLARDRARIASTGLTISPWLQALSDFTGQLFKRYSHMNPLYILQYVLMQLRQGNLPNLVVLREMIEQMSGISMSTEYNDKQLMALMGGPELRRLTHLEVKDRRYDSKVPANRLMKILVDEYLAAPFLVAITQERQSCIAKSKHTSLKLIAENFDEMHQSLLQYCEFLASNLSTSEFATEIPSILELTKTYKIDLSTAFNIHRRCLSERIKEYDALHPPVAKPRQQSKETSEKPQLNGDVEMDEAQADDEKKEESAIDTSTATPSEEPASPWHPVLQEIIDEITPILPSSIHSRLSIPFYVTFWQLSAEDVFAPSEAYNECTKKIMDKIQAIKRDRKDMSAAAVKRRENEENELKVQYDELRNEMNRHIGNFLTVKKRIGKEREHWFPSFHGKHDVLNSELLQECFLPRMVLSPHDSFYSFKMMHMLHTSSAPGFATMHFLDKLFNDRLFGNLIFQFTPREAENFSRFVAECLKLLGSWHRNKKDYEHGALGINRHYIGFVRSFKEGKPDVFVEYEGFRSLLYKWHNNIYNALKSCLKPGGEYMHIHNALKVLKGVSLYYPKVNFHGKGLLDILEAVAKDEAPPDKHNKKLPGEGRQDLSVLTNSVIAAVKPHAKTWIYPVEFRTGSAPPKEAKSAADAKSRSGTPKANTATNSPAMNPKAEDFRPKVDTEVAAGYRKTSVGNREDGEISATPKTETRAPAVLSGVSGHMDPEAPQAKADGLQPSAGLGRDLKPANSRINSPRSMPGTPPYSSGAQTNRATQENRPAHDRRSDRAQDGRPSAPPYARHSESSRMERPSERVRDVPRDGGRDGASSMDRPRGMPRDSRAAAADRQIRGGPLRPEEGGSRPESRSSNDGVRLPPQYPSTPSQSDLSNMNPARAAAFNVANGPADARSRPLDRHPEAYDGHGPTGRDGRGRYPSPGRGPAFPDHPAEAMRDSRGRGGPRSLHPESYPAPRSEYARDMAPDGPRAPYGLPNRPESSDFDRYERGQRTDLIGGPNRGPERAGGFHDYTRQPAPRQQDLSYGRLNQDPAATASHPPANPRGPKGHPPASLESRVSSIEGGPEQLRAESRRQSMPQGGPSTPGGLEPGMHPDRLNMIDTRPSGPAAGTLPPSGPRAGGPTRGPPTPSAMTPPGPMSRGGQPLNSGPPSHDRRGDQRKLGRLQDTISRSAAGPPPAMQMRNELGPDTERGGNSAMSNGSRMPPDQPMGRFDDGRGPPPMRRRPDERFDDGRNVGPGPAMFRNNGGGRDFAASGPPPGPAPPGARGGRGPPMPSEPYARGDDGYGMRGGPPNGPPGGRRDHGRDSGGGYGGYPHGGGGGGGGQMSGPGQQMPPKRELLGPGPGQAPSPGSRKRDWNGDGPGGGDEKRPRRGGSSR